MQTESRRWKLSDAGDWRSALIGRGLEPVDQWSYQSPAPLSLQRLPVSSDYHSTATTILLLAPRRVLREGLLKLSISREIMPTSGLERTGALGLAERQF